MTMIKVIISVICDVDVDDGDHQCDDDDIDDVDDDDDSCDDVA